MRVFLAGASGAIGRPLIRALVHNGHDVLGLTRAAEKAATITSLGATPVIADALDRTALLRAVDGMHADAVLHELTALTRPPMRHSGMVPTDVLRTDGTANLLAAADVLGAKRFVTQSIIFGYGMRDHGDTVLTEDSPFGRRAGDKNDPHIAAMRANEEQAFTAPEGIALRYGMFYGGNLDTTAPTLRKRGIPVFRGGAIGWVHHEDAATATVAALERGEAGQAYNIVDDLPATWSEMFTALAAAVDAPRPRRMPVPLFRLIASYVSSFAIDTVMHVSNAKARAELGWTPRYPTYREGIAEIRTASS
jgi:nucleoside-diphosphate-sugar epimerase